MKMQLIIKHVMKMETQLFTILGGVGGSGGNSVSLSRFSASSNESSCTACTLHRLLPLR